jgi:hypothetical protein
MIEERSVARHREYNLKLAENINTHAIKIWVDIYQVTWWLSQDIGIMDDTDFLLQILLHFQIFQKMKIY